FHGTAFEFVRNEALNARNLFAPPRASSPGKPLFRRNQFGFVLGGRSCTTRHSFSWITREAARLLLASALLRYRRRFNAKVFSPKLSRVSCLKFSILLHAGRFPTTLFRKTEWIPPPFLFSLDIRCLR